jgi:hypothetical protein
MGGAYCCRAVASVDRHSPKVEGGSKRWEKVGEGGSEGRMGWDLLAVSCAGSRGRSDEREAMNR